MAHAVTDARTEKLLQGLRMGMTRRAASGFAGFSKSTFYRMLETDDGTLGTLVENAEAEAEATYSAIIAREAAVPKNWTAWWVERRHPQDYARREKVEMTGKDGGPIDHRSIVDLPDHERAALAEAIRRHLRGEEEPEPSPASDSVG